MTIPLNHLYKRLKAPITLILVLILGVSPVLAGITITGSNGIVMTGADGVTFDTANGIVMTGADGLLTYPANGIVMTGADGIVMTGADGFSYPDSVQMAGADGIVMTGADGIVMTGADGIVMTGADGKVYNADSVTVILANGIVMTGADGIVMTGADGVEKTASDGIVMTGADGIVMTGADGIGLSGAASVSGTGTDGVSFSVSPNGIRFSGVTNIVITGADGISVSGPSGVVVSGAGGLLFPAEDTALAALQSVDPGLAVQLNSLTDDSGVNAVVVYHHLPTDADLGDLQRIGVVGGTRFRVLPMITLTATRDQIIAISRLSAVRSIYGNRTLDLSSEPEVRATTGVDRAWRDAEVTNRNLNSAVSGRGVTVAVLDTGVDGTHGDLAGRVAQNIKLASTQSANVGFNYPINSESLSNTDQAYGHGTFVAGIIAGNGTLSNGKYKGVAPGASVVGLSAGDLSLLYVLEGFDYLLTHGELGVRVVNCSFSANTVFDTNDPVNVATRMLTDRGVNVVFSAGNTGPGQHSLNPYAVAPWVVSVGATDTAGHLASFSSRGDFASSLFHPTLVAPGVTVVSARGSGVTNVTGVEGIAGADAQRLDSSEIPNYTTASGTSFSTPQVVGTIALMLEANPNLTPAQVKEILRRTATPLPPYYQHEVGAGMLNVHAAVLQAAFPSRRIGSWRETVDRHQVQFISNAPVPFSGIVQPGTNSETTLSIPDNALIGSVQISWGPLWSVNDLALAVYGPDSSPRGRSNAINLPGLTGKRERVALVKPSSGAWRVAVNNTLGIAGIPQQYFGVLEIGRAQYSAMSDIGGLSPALRDEIYQNIRSYVMYPIGSRFRPDFAVSRADLAMTLVMGARVPQYLPGHASYQDNRDVLTMPFVESAQASPNGPLFVDVVPGGRFRPDDRVTRLAAVIAMIRAAGLRSEAEAKSGSPLPFLDVLSIPNALRGYVAVAAARGIIASESNFRPQAFLTRAELAHAMAVVEKLATQ